MDALDYWFPWQPSVYQSATLDLTLEQDGLYRRLIDHYMITREPLPNSKGALARISGSSIEKITEHYSDVIEAYFYLEDGLLKHEKCNEVLDEQDARSRKKSKAGKKGAKKRWSQDTENIEENASAIADPKQPHSTNIAQDRTGQDRTGQDSKKERGSEPSPPELQMAMSAYNNLAKKYNLPKVQILTETRKSKLKNRLKECGGLEGWNLALEKVAESDFCIGKNEKGWKVSFDFLMQQQSFIKLLEGTYDGKTKHKPSPDEELDKYLDRERNG